MNRLRTLFSHVLGDAGPGREYCFPDLDTHKPPGGGLVVYDPEIDAETWIHAENRALVDLREVV